MRSAVGTLVALLCLMQSAEAQTLRARGASTTAAYEEKKRQASDIAVTIVTSGITCTCARFAEDIRDKIDMERLNYDNNEAMLKLRAGEIAAMIVVSGAPQSALTGFKKEDGVHFLGLDQQTLPNHDLAPVFDNYLPAKLTHEQYPALIPEGGKSASSGACLYSFWLSGALDETGGGMNPRRCAVVGALCGTVVLASQVAARLAGPGSLGIENTGALIEDRRATSLASGAEHVDAPPATAMGEDSVAVADIESGNPALPDPRPMLPAATPPVLLVSTADPVQNATNAAASSVETPDECIVPEICIDEYLWSLYQRTPKVDTNKVRERIKGTVKKKGKTRTIIKTVAKYVEADFTWKDPIAAQEAGMSLKDYVIGGMDRGFKLKLYRALRAMDDAGFMPGITSAFRDDYRQSIASGKKAASDSSYHGGSRRGGYGYGLAADLVSVRGDTRMQRYLSSQELWKWIDAHENELGIGRPYLGRDPPHVGPIDGQEYASKRGRANVQKAGLQTKDAHEARLEATKRQVAERDDPDLFKPAEPAKHPLSLTVR